MEKPTTFGPGSKWIVAFLSKKSRNLIYVENVLCMNIVRLSKPLGEKSET